MTATSVPSVASNTPAGLLPPPPPAAASTPPSGALARGRYETLLGILARGYALTLVTFGIYRFWMKTNMRRWYWSNTVIGGDALEYTGTGREMFVGFLIAVGILLPLYLIVVVGTYLSDTLDWNQATWMFIGLTLVLAQYAVYSARRYRLTRTVWRGLAFSQGGSGWIYMALWIVMTAISFLTLGLAAPWTRAQLHGYMVRNTRFGTAPGAFSPKLGAPFLWWFLLWVPILVAVAVALFNLHRDGHLADLFSFLALMFSTSGDPPDGAAVTGLLEHLGPLFGATTFATLWGLVLWPAYKVAEFRAFTDGTRIGPVEFKSYARILWYYGAYIRLFLMNMLAFSLFIAFIGIMIGIVFAAFGMGDDPKIYLRIITDPLITMGITLAVVLVAILAQMLAATLKEIILAQGFWRHGLSTLSVTGLHRVGEVMAVHQSDRAVGEGFADAFDVGGL